MRLLGLGSARHLRTYLARLSTLGTSRSIHPTHIWPTHHLSLKFSHIRPMVWNWDRRLEPRSFPWLEDSTCCSQTAFILRTYTTSLFSLCSAQITFARILALRSVIFSNNQLFFACIYFRWRKRLLASRSLLLNSR